jgi:hypothetical protein
MIPHVPTEARFYLTYSLSHPYKCKGWRKGTFSCFFLLGDREQFTLFVIHDRADIPREHKTIRLLFMRLF